MELSYTFTKEDALLNLRKSLSSVYPKKRKTPTFIKLCYIILIFCGTILLLVGIISWSREYNAPAKSYLIWGISFILFVPLLKIISQLFLKIWIGILLFLSSKPISKQYPMQIKLKIASEGIQTETVNITKVRKWNSIVDYEANQDSIIIKSKQKGDDLTIPVRAFADNDKRERFLNIIKDKIKSNNRLAGESAVIENQSLEH